MAYDMDLADRVRIYLAEVPRIKVTEKAMFRGLAFMVNDKMCVNISGNNLMCRIDPKRYDEIARRNGFMPMIMKGREMNGYCYVTPEGFKSPKDFEYWLQLCLEFNPSAKSSKKSKSSINAGLDTEQAKRKALTSKSSTSNSLQPKSAKSIVVKGAGSQRTSKKTAHQKNNTKKVSESERKSPDKPKAKKRSIR